MNKHEETEQLRRELESYNYFCRKIEENEALIEQMFIIQSNYHGIDYSRVPVHTQRDGKPDSYYDLLSRKDKVLQETEALRSRKKRVDEFMDALDSEEQQIITERFIRGLKLEKIGMNHNYSVSGIQWKITSIIKKGV